MRPSLSVVFEGTERRGHATLSEVSYSGARLEVAAPLPPLGDTIRIYVWPPHHAEPFELVGRVVGARDDGFAVEYEAPGQAICQWIDALQVAGSDAPPDAGERRAASG